LSAEILNSEEGDTRYDEIYFLLIKMYILQVVIHNFRGIKELDWTPSGRLACLVGPGDSMKTTVLDAIEYTLSPNWNIQFSDVDFYNTVISNPIEISVTVGDLPGDLLTEDKFGLYKRGWRQGSGLSDEPREDEGACEAVLTIVLHVDSNLEPEWNVVTDRDPEGKLISWRDRARLGMVRLGAEIDREFSWNRLSSLTKMTSDSGETTAIIAEAHRKLRDAVKSQNMDKLLEAAKNVEKAAKRLGFTPTTEFVPRLESRLVSLGMGALSLHDGEIPLASAGLGSRRLVALAIQRAAILNGAIVLIDEVEYGLEPHRIRRLLRSLKRGLQSVTATTEQEEPALGQVIMTTHSPTPVLELDATDVNVVRVSPYGKIDIHDVPGDLQGTLKYAPYALLGRKVIVCEGETEVGLCWGLEEFWQSRNGNESIACRGVVVANGGGENAAARAKALRDLGYEVALLADADKTINPDEDALRTSGVNVVRWDGNASTEERVVLDVLFYELKGLLKQVIGSRGEISVADSIAAQGIAKPIAAASDLDSWLAVGDCTEDRLRKAIGRAAKKKDAEWFKSIGGGRMLAAAVVDSFSSIGSTDTAKKLEILEHWCYDG